MTKISPSHPRFSHYLQLFHSCVTRNKNTNRVPCFIHWWVRSELIAAASSWAAISKLNWQIWSGATCLAPLINTHIMMPWFSLLAESCRFNQSLQNPLIISCDVLYMLTWKPCVCWIMILLWAFTQLVSTEPESRAVSTDALAWRMDKRKPCWCLHAS